MEFVLLGLLVLSFPIIAIVALVKAVNLSDRLAGDGSRASPRWKRRPRARRAQRRTRSCAEAGEPRPPNQRPNPACRTPAARHDACRSARRSDQVRAAARAELHPSRRAPPRGFAATAACRTRRPEPAQSFEERFGTRWMVWVGGVALALGGIFLVKYSIEAGLIGPGMRLFFGALLAAALVAGGEWTRRRSELAAASPAFRARTSRASSPRPAPPCAYATVYAAYGALRLPRAGVRLRAARRRRAGDARRGAAARPGARGARPRRRLRHAAAGLDRRSRTTGRSTSISRW